MNGYLYHIFFILSLCFSSFIASLAGDQQRVVQSVVYQCHRRLPSNLLI